MAQLRRAVFHPLKVSDITELTDDAVCITFAVPPELAADYDFIQGQHVTLRTSLACASGSRFMWMTPMPPA